MSDNNFFKSISCDNLNYVDCYKGIFNGKWYPDFFVKDDEFQTFYIGDISILNDFINKITQLSGDDFIFMRTSDYREEKQYKCFIQVKHDNKKFDIQDLFNHNLHSLDDGAVSFGSNSEWAVYFGEDLYDYGRTGNFVEFAFIFVKKNRCEFVFDFFQNRFGNSLEIKEVLKEKYFKAINADDKIYHLSYNVK